MNFLHAMEATESMIRLITMLVLKAAATAGEQLFCYYNRGVDLPILSQRTACWTPVGVDGACFSEYFRTEAGSHYNRLCVTNDACRLRGMDDKCVDGDSLHKQIFRTFVEAQTELFVENQTVLESHFCCCTHSLCNNQKPGWARIGRPNNSTEPTPEEALSLIGGSSSTATLAAGIFSCLFFVMIMDRFVTYGP